MIKQSGEPFERGKRVPNAIDSSVVRIEMKNHLSPPGDKAENLLVSHFREEGGFFYDIDMGTGVRVLMEGERLAAFLSLKYLFELHHRKLVQLGDILNTIENNYYQGYAVKGEPKIREVLEETRKLTGTLNAEIARVEATRPKNDLFR